MREFTKDESEWLEFLGNFGPTVNAQDKMLKGYTKRGKTYLDASDLKDLASVLISVSEWLLERAENETIRTTT